MKKLIILGTRGIPAKHGGFETFAERLSLYLVALGWHVTVYCQEEGAGQIFFSEWNGVARVHIPVKNVGALGSVIFDWKAAFHAMSQKAVVLTLGYNTAIFNILQRFAGQANIINMDGIEWRRDKWGFAAKTWFWINERCACYVGNHLVADNPAIEDHISSRVNEKKVTMIPYGANEVTDSDEKILAWSGLQPEGYSVIIARPEPENSFFEMISAFGKRRRNHILVVLGKFEPKTNSYHRRVLDAASAEVIFLGAIYEAHIVNALRYFARFYLHGHTVGGTNPSLVEAMGAGCAVIAHDNVFNRWVAGESAEFFKNERDCDQLFSRLIADDGRQRAMKEGSRLRFRAGFTWTGVLAEYEKLLSGWLNKV